MPEFDGKTNRFITFYVDTEDVKQAARLASITPEKGESLYRNRKVRAAIDARLEKVHNEQAKLLAKYRKVEVRFLDDRLVRAIEEGSKRGRTEALELGYQRTGLMRAGEFIGATSGGAAAGPMIYRALTVTKTEQTEQVEIIVPAQPEVGDY